MKLFEKIENRPATTAGDGDGGPISGAVKDKVREALDDIGNRLISQPTEETRIVVGATTAKESAAGTPSPFQPADKMEKRPKILLWGDSGSGKTMLALQFPAPVVIDLERGSELYAGERSFDVVHTQDPDRVRELIDWLRANKHPYRTFVLDPVTLYWEALQRKWSDIFLRRNKSGKGFKFEFYDFQPRDWMQIRDEYQDLMRAILGLDMTVVVTAHSKAQYDDGQFMKKIGDTFDSQKKTPYLFDVVLQLTHDPATGRHLSRVVKDRTRRLPQEAFETNYAVFERAFGESLRREARPFSPATTEQLIELWKLAKDYGMTESQVLSRLETYGAQRPEDLSAENAATICERLRAATAKKKA